MIKTNFIYNREDYLEKRLAGKDVISVAVLYGINAIHKASGNFTVLVVNMKEFSFYTYNIDKGRFSVLCFEESKPYTLADVIPLGIPDGLKNEKMQKWWNCVFFERDGKRTYDSFYDDLHIADNTNVAFKDVIKGFGSALSKMPLSKLGNHVFLTGDLAENPLFQYVLQSHLSKEISILRCNEETISYSENEMVILPKEKLDGLKLNTNITMDLASMVNEPINITLPLDSSTMKLDSSIKGKEMLPNTNIKWEDILNDKEHEDYRIKGTDLFFKTVKLHVECDVFQNIFLYCEDMSGNQKVIQVK